jgi:hypothetical protein
MTCLPFAAVPTIWTMDPLGGSAFLTLSIRTASNFELGFGQLTLKGVHSKLRPQKTKGIAARRCSKVYYSKFRCYGATDAYRVLLATSTAIKAIVCPSRL